MRLSNLNVFDQSGQSLILVRWHFSSIPATSMSKIITIIIFVLVGKLYGPVQNDNIHTSMHLKQK